jgi:hypothetical protein
MINMERQASKVVPVVVAWLPKICLPSSLAVAASAAD